MLWGADVDHVGPVRQYELMDKKADIAWKGWGRLLFIGLGISLILLAVPLVFSREDGAAAGWDIFLGLLAIGAVASGSRKAPLLALILAALMALRLLATIIHRPSVLDLVASLLFLATAAGAAYDLRKQSMSALLSCPDRQLLE